MRLIATLATLATLFLGAMAHAGERLVVVELFTSQGCSSCPPADALLGELTQRPDVLPLALHVDYWDYIGWKDSFGSPRNTERQYAYARVAGNKSVYTPQMIVGGEDHVIGFKPMKLASEIERQRARPEVIDLTARRTGGGVQVTLVPKTPLPGAHDVVLVRYTPREKVAIRRGENAGHTLTYHNIVRDMARIGTWNGAGPVRFDAPLSGDGEYAVLVQRAGHGAIVGAARVR